MITNRSRLARKRERQNQKTLLISLFGIAIITILTFKFGVPLLVNFSLFMSQFGEQKEQTNKESHNFVPPPVINAVPNATNSAFFTISGLAIPKSIVSLYINNELVDKKSPEEDGKFIFADIKLNKGENIIKTKAEEEKRESEFSDNLIVVYKDSSPNLTIDSPSEGKAFQKDEKNVLVVGKTDPGVKVTINGLWSVVDINGNFSYNLPLQNGENKIKVVASDEAGNKTEVERKVTYSP